MSSFLPSSPPPGSCLQSCSFLKQVWVSNIFHLLSATPRLRLSQLSASFSSLLSPLLGYLLCLFLYTPISAPSLNSFSFSEPIWAPCVISLQSLRVYRNPLNSVFLFVCLSSVCNPFCLPAWIHILLNLLYVTAKGLASLQLN